MFVPRLWILSAGLICIGMLTIINGCGKRPGASGLRYGDGSVAGSNVPTTRIVDVHTFEGVKIEDNFDITIAQGSAPRVIITADDNIARLLKPRIKDNILHVEFEQGFRTRNEFRIRIETPELERIDHLGKGLVILDQIHLRHLALKLSGTGHLSGMGRVDKLWIEANGAGNIELNDIITTDAEILLTGRGRVTVTVTEKLEATNIGRGEIIYAGNPSKTTIDNSGQGIIRKK